MKRKRIKRLFIANRGEIALRIIRAAHQEGIQCIVPYVHFEADQPFVIAADYQIQMNSEILSETYLNPDYMISLAKTSSADAIHPGYGFLSENEGFATKTTNNGLIWVGPSSESIGRMGDKIEACTFAKKQGLPVIDSWLGEKSFFAEILHDLPYPLVIKASAGGGGKGMKIVEQAGDFMDAFDAAQREAKAYFGNDQVYVEKYLSNPRHIEVQIFGDEHGNVVHLFERDCSIQRRHQKIVEEAGQINLSHALRNKITTASVNLAKALQYIGAGTIEYLVDASGNFYFLEMNTRIQVEHPVTEEITGIDLVREQLTVAMGNPLSFTQDEVFIRGHAIECRIYAEDPEHDFRPSPGIIQLHQYENIRDARIETGYARTFEVAPAFDPMISKIITTGKTRSDAIAKMIATLREYSIVGIQTNQVYLLSLLQHEAYVNYQVSTSFCRKYHDPLMDHIQQTRTDESLQRAAILMFLFHYMPGISASPTENRWSSLTPWRLNGEFILKTSDLSLRFRKIHANLRYIQFEFNGLNYRGSIQHNGNYTYKVILDDNSFEGILLTTPDNVYTVGIDGVIYEFSLPGMLEEESWQLYKKKRNDQSGANGYVYSPLNGKAVKIAVNLGDKVSKGDLLVIIESMKTENKILATDDGIVTQLEIQEGEQVKGKQMVLKLTKEKSGETILN